MFTMHRASLSAVSFIFSVLAAVSSCAFAPGSGPTEDNLHPFTLASPDFKDGAALPPSSEYGSMGCTGDDLAPTFSWKNVPAQTSSFAFVMNDPDAAVAGGFHHWVVYNIPGNVSTLKGNAPFTEGTTSLNTRAYFGPCPPATGQLHHYTFTLYALSISHIQKEGLTYDGLMQEIGGHVVGATTLIGTFRRVPGK